MYHGNKNKNCFIKIKKLSPKYGSDCGKEKALCMGVWPGGMVEGGEGTCGHVQSLQSCLTNCSPMDCSPPASSVHGILQTRILEWVAMTSSRGSSQPRGRTCVSCFLCLLHWQVDSLPLSHLGIPWRNFYYALKTSLKYIFNWFGLQTSKLLVNLC